MPPPAPPPPVNTGRAELEAVLQGAPLPSEQAAQQAQVAQQRQADVARFQAALPPRFRVVDDGDFFAVLSPSGEAIALPEEVNDQTIAEAQAEIQARLAQGMYPEVTAATQPFGSQPQQAAATQLAQQAAAAARPPEPVAPPAPPPPAPAPPAATSWWDALDRQERRRIATAAGVRIAPAAAWASFTDETKAALEAARNQPTSQPPAPDVTTPAAPPSNSGPSAPADVTTPAPDVTEAEAEEIANRPARNIEEARRALEVAGSVLLPDGKRIGVAESGRRTGWVVRTRYPDGHGSELGGDPRGGGFSRAEAIKRALQDIYFPEPQQEPQPSAAPTAPPQGEGAQDQAPAAPKPRPAPVDSPPPNLGTPETRPTSGSSETTGKSDQPPAPPAGPKRLVSDDRMAELKAKLKAKLDGTTLNAGMDPELVALGAELAVGYLERGVTRFREWAAQVVADLGDGVRPYLRGWYEGARYYPGFDATGMTPVADMDAEIRAFEEGRTDGLGSQAPGAPGTAPAGTPDAPKGDGPDAAPPAGDSDAGGGPIQPDPDRDGDGEPAPADGLPGVGGTEAPGDDGGRGDGDAGDRPATGRPGNGEGGADGRIRGLDYRITDADQIGAGGAVTKARQNIAAIRLAKQIEAEARPATADEQAVLVKYVGWGGIPQVFDEPLKPEWEKLGTELRGLLTDAEWAAAKASTLNAHYTSPQMIEAMWDAVTRMGFQGGRVLEPSSGVGHFLGLAPAYMRERGSRFVAVELDKMTGLIAGLLYPQSRVMVQGFEQFQAPDGYFDLAIGNVPFGNFKLSETRYDPLDLNIHDHFFVKALDLVRPGGIVAFITSMGTMDKYEQVARRAIGERADLVAAIRLPKDTFQKNAMTDVTTDLIVLRRREPKQPAGGPRFLQTRTIESPEGPIEVNEYFVANPDMMLGEMRRTGTRYRSGLPELVAPEGADTASEFRKRITDLPEDAYQARPSSAAETAPRPTLLDVPTGLQEASFFEQDGKLYQRRQGVGVPVDVGKDRAAMIRAFIGLRDTTRRLLAEQLKDTVPDEQIKAMQADLNRRYDAFVKAHGPINKVISTTIQSGRMAGRVLKRRPNLQVLREDPDAFLVAALELYDEATGKAEKAAIFRERVIARPQRATTASTPQDALLISLDETGKVDMGRIAELLGTTDEQAAEALGGLVFRDPATEGWVTADEYLSGDVRAKLAQAEKGAAVEDEYERNVEALRAVQPKDLVPSPDPEASEIDASIGAAWIDKKEYVAFLAHLIDADDADARTVAQITHLPKAASWMVAPGSALRSALAAKNKWGTGRRPVWEIMEAGLNAQRVKVYDTLPDGKRVLDQEATLAAQQKQREIEAEFRRWFWSDPDRRDRYARIYNDTYNNLVPRRFDGSLLSFPGLVAKIRTPAGDKPFALREHQRAAVWRTIQTGNTLYAHEVGAGKTFTMIAAGMEQKRLGLIRKPMYVVPNHMLEQFSREFLLVYPTANLLVADKAKTAKANRKAFVGQIATGNHDAVIITHSAFGRLSMKGEAYERYVQEQLEELEDLLRAAKADKSNRSLVKMIEGAKKKLLKRLQKLMATERKDHGATFEDTGVDFLFVDEAHLFKNLAFSTKMGNVRGLAQGDSQRAMDLFLKIRHLDGLNGGRTVVFATGTPVSNTMAELYTMQRYLQPDALRRVGIDHFDAWAATFGEVTESLELAPGGNGLRTVSRFARFRNIPELISMFSRVADVQTADMLKLPRPELEGGRPQIVEAEPTAAQDMIFAGLAQRAEAMKGKPPSKGGDNILKIVSEGRKAALDPRLLDETYAPGDSRKLRMLVDNVVREYEAGNASETAKAQVIFSDLGVPGRKRRKAAAVTDDDADTDSDAADDTEADDDEGVDTTEDAGGSAAQDDASDDTGFDVYNEVKRRLVARGIPADEIAFIHDAKTDDQKAELFAAIRSGRKRIMLGSTEKMGVGTNVQDLLIAMHHLDAPWRPADVAQRDGRILRQGNRNPAIRIYRYITKRSFDAYLWQTLETKARFIGQLLAGAKGKRRIEDIDSPLPEASEIKAIATGDPRIVEFAEVERDLQVLSAERSNFETEQQRARGFLRSADRDGHVKRLADVTEDQKAAIDLRGDNFRFTRDGKESKSRGVFAEAIEKMAAPRVVAFAKKNAPRGPKAVREAETIDLAPIKIGDWTLTIQATVSNAWAIFKEGANHKKDAPEYHRLDIAITPRLTSPAGRIYSGGTIYAETQDADGKLADISWDGVPQRFTNIMGTVGDPKALLAEAREALETLDRNLASARETAGKDWPNAKPYQAKLLRYYELKLALSVGLDEKARKELEGQIIRLGGSPFPKAPEIRLRAGTTSTIDAEGTMTGDDATFYSTPFDPEAFDRFIIRPLREALGGTTALTRIAKAVREQNVKALRILWKGVPPSDGITVKERVENKDLGLVKRWLATPRWAYKRFPEIARLIEAGIRAEENQSVWANRLTEQYERIRKALAKDKGRWEAVQVALWEADADEVDIENPAQAKEWFDSFGLSPAEATAAAALNRLLVKQARLVDQHRRDMLPKVRAQKALIWERMAEVLRSKSVPTEEYAKAYRRRNYLNARIRDGKGDLGKQALEVERMNEKLRDMRLNDPAAQALLAKLQAKYDELHARLAATSVRRRAGYVPHKFYGSWRLFIEEGKDAEGNPKRRELTSDHGFFDSKGQAIAAAERYLKEHPEAKLTVEPKLVVFPDDPGGATVTDAAYSRLKRDLEKAAAEEGITLDGVAALQGVAKRRSRRRTFTPGLFRKGAEGFSTDLDKVMRTHINQTVRYVTMDKLKFDYVETTEKIGLSPYRLTSIKLEGKENLQKAIEAWWTDVNGAKQSHEAQIDAMMQRAGVTGSTLAAFVPGLLVTASGAPVTGMALTGYLGFRAYRAMTKGGEFPMRAMVQGITSDMAHLKLGMAVNVGSALVNLSQTFLNTMPVYGVTATLNGMKRAAAALWSQARNADAPGRMSEDAHLLTRADIRTRFRYAEDAGFAMKAESAARRVSMWAFEGAERMNRATAFLAAYHKAEADGASPAAAMEAGKEAIRRTQFHGGQANRPELIRVRAAQVPLQFKNFLLQEVAFFFGLKPTQMLAFVAMMVMLGGMLAFPGFQILDWLWDLVTDFKMSDAVAEWIAEAQMMGDLAGTAAHVLARGLPALLGADITQRIGMGAGFLPDQGSDFYGPGPSTAVQLAQAERQRAQLVDTLLAISPGAMPLKVLEAIANGASITAPRFWSGGVFGDGRAVWTNPRKRGNEEIEPTTGELATRAAGLQPARWTNRGALERRQLDRQQDRRKDENAYLAEIIQARRNGQPERIPAIRAEAARNGVRITQDRLVQALRTSEMDRAERAARSMPRQDRGEFRQRVRAIDELGGAR